MTTTTQRAQTLDELLADFKEEDGWQIERIDDRSATATFTSAMSSYSRWLSLDNYGVTVVIGGYHWGKGPDLTDAKRQFRRVGGRLTDGYVILTFPEETLFLGVDQMGYVHWKGEPPTEKVVHARGSKARR